MLIIVDAGIPRISEYLEPFGAVRSIPGHEIRKSDLKDADALVVRTVTSVDWSMLDGTPVKLVASATAGVDHIDIESLEAHGVVVAHAPGCNAPAVCDYVLTAIFDLAAGSDLDPFNATIGIVGVGNVGGRLKKRLDGLGIRTLLNDPPKQEAVSSEDVVDPSRYVDLDELLAASDIVSLHVPLTRTGAHPTLSLIGDSQLESLKDGALLINTSRGGVVDEDLLKADMAEGRIGAIVDVWQNEPAVDCDLATKVSIATPHIAGYGIESKDRAARAVVDAVASLVGNQPPSAHPPNSRQLPIVSPGADTPDIQFCSALARQAYDVGRDHLHMQGMCSFPQENRSEYFLELRNGYRLRSEFASHVIERQLLTGHQAKLASALGFTVKG